MRVLAIRFSCRASASSRCRGDHLVGPRTCPAQRTDLVWSSRVFTTRRDFESWLASRGSNYELWSQRHPTRPRTHRPGSVHPRSVSGTKFGNFLRGKPLWLARTSSPAPASIRARTSARTATAAWSRRASPSSAKERVGWAISSASSGRPRRRTSIPFIIETAERDALRASFPRADPDGLSLSNPNSSSGGVSRSRPRPGRVSTRGAAGA